MEYEDQKKSKFNAGVALTERIDGLQCAINAARFNPLKVNFDTMTYNYEIMISANDGLLKEVWAKLSPKEQEFAERIRKAINNYMKSFPIISVTGEGKTSINQKNYARALELIDFYERMNKNFLDVHSLNAPDFEDDEGL
jgi:hypothetical protein